MPALVEKMAQSQVWILGTSIYCNGPTGQFKTFLDRCYSAKPLTFKGNRVILVIPLGAGDARSARHTVGMLTDSLGKKKIFTTLIAPGVFGLGVVRRYIDVMAAARRAGREAIERPD